MKGRGAERGFGPVEGRGPPRPGGARSAEQGERAAGGTHPLVGHLPGPSLSGRRSRGRGHGPATSPRRRRGGGGRAARGEQRRSWRRGGRVPEPSRRGSPSVRSSRACGRPAAAELERPSEETPAPVGVQTSKTRPGVFDLVCFLCFSLRALISL